MTKNNNFVAPKQRRISKPLPNPTKEQVEQVKKLYTKKK